MPHVAGRRDWMPWIVALVAVGIALVTSLAPRSRARAQDEAPAATEPAAEPGLATEHHPFELCPADPGALVWADYSDTPPPEPLPGEWEGELTPERYRALTAETKASALAIEEWADLSHSVDVTNSYSSYTTMMVEQAAVRRAEYEAGLASAGLVGVE